MTYHYLGEPKGRHASGALWILDACPSPIGSSGDIVGAFMSRLLRVGGTLQAADLNFQTHKTGERAKESDQEEEGGGGVGEEGREEEEGEGRERITGKEVIRMMNIIVEEEEQPRSWWFICQKRANSTSQSPWLSSTLLELDEKTQEMLKLIDEDADSFAKRAEMYYKKRPQLVNMIENFYRAHRSLAEQYDQLKFGCGTRRSTSFDPAISFRSWSQCTSSNSETDEAPKCLMDSFDFDESEIDDPEEEEEEEFEVQSKFEVQQKEDVCNGPSGDAVKLKQELQLLQEENAALKADLTGKDEEKREVIRQMAVSLDILKEENVVLRRCLKDDHPSKKKAGSMFGFKKLTKEMFSGKLFGGQTKSPTTIIAL